MRTYLKRSTTTHATVILPTWRRPIIVGTVVRKPFGMWTAYDAAGRKLADCLTVSTAHAAVDENRLAAAERRG
jgi:hypothetical protein